MFPTRNIFFLFLFRNISSVSFNLIMELRFFLFFFLFKICETDPYRSVWTDAEYASFVRKERHYRFDEQAPSTQVYTHDSSERVFLKYQYPK